MDITDSLPLVVIESPYAGDVECNVQFCRNVCRWAIARGYSPYAMHLLYPQMLDDKIPDERAMGISCGLSWTKMGNEVWYVLRPGDAVSKGMQMAMDRDARRIAAGEQLVARSLRFSQEGQLREGWVGPVPATIYETPSKAPTMEQRSYKELDAAMTPGSTEDPPVLMLPFAPMTDATREQTGARRRS